MLKRALTLSLLLAAGAGAAPDPPAIEVPTAADLAELERARDKRPKRAERRDALALAYYRFARAAFDRGELPVYEDYLGRATHEWVESVRLDPESPSPHVYMGIAAAYQGRIDDTLDSLQNARALEPRNPLAYTNIAETLIYAGREAREVEVWLSRGERMGANPAVVELNYCLLRWRDGDVKAAATRFRNAAKLDPAVVRVWNEAPVAQPIRSFSDLTAYCCGSPACGPYLARACASSELEVAQRELPEETALRELRIEMERRRELERIYRERKDLDITVKPPEAEAHADDAPSPTQETPP